MILVLTMLLALHGEDCGGEEDSCYKVSECEEVCGTCVARCLPTGEDGAGECHCSCGP